jgi:hypothetical protein
MSNTARRRKESLFTGGTSIGRRLAAGCYAPTILKGFDENKGYLTV